MTTDKRRVLEREEGGGYLNTNSSDQVLQNILGEVAKKKFYPPQYLSRNFLRLKIKVNH